MTQEMQSPKIVDKQNTRSDDCTENSCSNQRPHRSFDLLPTYHNFEFGTVFSTTWMLKPLKPPNSPQAFNNMDARAFKKLWLVLFPTKCASNSLKPPRTSKGCRNHPAALRKTAIARKRRSKRSLASPPCARLTCASLRTRWPARGRTVPSTCCSADWILYSNRSRLRTKAPNNLRYQGRAARSSAGMHTYTCRWGTW